MYPLLDRTNSPADLKKLDIAELKQLCNEIRSYMVECLSRNPGHLASSLGAVEIIVAMHYLYDCPQDKFVFDVGHQAYAHKIITGRREQFRDIRTKEGISGFPRTEESIYDAFGVGHSSTSISAALGIAEAFRLTGRNDKVLALIGDGALTGGMSFEGLNNAGASNADLLVIINDNNQSIDGNKGALHNYLLKVTTSSGYNQLKLKVWDILGESTLRSILQRWVRGIKSWLVKKSGGDLFESLGFRYFGPVDGNDIEAVIRTLHRIKDMRGARILHCMTVKGKGYAPAEADPVTWHAPGRFNPETGERRNAGHDRDRYQDVFGQVLLDLARKDDRVVGITPAMATGCGMSLLARELPRQFFDVGIEEEHAVTFSAGLAASGIKPFCNIYSSFSQRAYDQIIHDVALQKLPVVFCLDRAGLVGEDGATHQGSFDLASYRCIPGMVISSPRNEAQLKDLMYTAYKYDGGPFIIRYERGMGEGVSWKDREYRELPLGKAETLREGTEAAVITIGPMAGAALEASGQFGDRVGVYDFKFLKPLDGELLDRIASRCGYILTVEDGCLKGGLYGAVTEHLAGRRGNVIIEGLGIGDEFPGQDRQSAQRALYGLDAEGIGKRLKKFLENSK